MTILIGIPSLYTFPFLAENATTLEGRAIVYAIDMKQAIDIYINHFHRQPYSIRQMADNE